MRTIKAIFLAMLLLTANVAMANDEEDIEFRVAVSEGNLPVVKKYIESGTMKVNDSYVGWTPVLAAAAKGQTPTVKYLVEKGADITYRHPITKLNALMYAAIEGNDELVEYLLQKGADPNIKLKGDVSLVRATRDEGHAKTVELLMKHGAKDDGCQEKCF